jgi:hypothetical protein
LHHAGFNRRTEDGMNMRVRQLWLRSCLPSLRIKLSAYIVYMIAWCLVPALFLALGACRGWDARPGCAPGATAL